MSDFKYVGEELELFAVARNWKSYWANRVRPFVAGDVLEVGAGIGSNTFFLASDKCKRWVCLEPDQELATQLRSTLAETATPLRYEVVCGTIQSLRLNDKFDTIIYIDVLEHIENDREELANAASFLHPGGRIIVLSPAHQSLYSPFDESIGHFRRYNRAMLQSITPPALRPMKVAYLDSAGLVLSFANMKLLRQSMPTKAQLRVWDKWVIPVSRLLDRCLFGAVGKSIVGVWQRV
jgi:SAM-dependent methyltransferase